MLPRLRSARPFDLERDPFAGFGQFFQHMLRDFSTPATTTAPAVNLWEEDGALFLEAAVPGYKPEDIQISVTGDRLVLEGKVDETTETDVSYHRRERVLSTFRRSFVLPFRVEDSKAEAKLVDGVLKVRFPRAQEALPREIKVEVASS